MIKIYTTLIFCLIGYGFLFSQHTDISPIEGKVILSVNGAVMFPYTDYASIIPTPFGTGALEYYFDIKSRHTIGLRFYGGIGVMEGWDTTRTPYEFSDGIFFFGGGITYSYSLSDKLVPYIFAGVTNLWYNPLDYNNNPIITDKPASQNLSDISYNYELGLKIFLSEGTSLNLSGGLFQCRTDKLDGLIAGSHFDIFYYGMAGISIAFSGKQDSDNDGVEDSKDACPGTPRGIKVDEKGCPLDSDNDGVPDYKDKCADTPAGVKADPNGCPEIKVILPDQAAEKINYNSQKEYPAGNMVYTDGKLYVVQISVWKTEQEAETQSKKLKENGYNAFVDKTLKDKWDSILYRVRIGYFRTYLEAKVIADKLR